MEEPYCTPTAKPAGPQETGKRAPWRRFASRWGLHLAFLGALVALAALLVCDASLAEAQSSHTWQATLNPKQIGASQDIVGCTIDGDDGQRCKTTLSDNTFSAGGTDYIVTQVFLNNDFSQLAFTIDKDVNAAVKGLSLYVDGREFPVAEATTDDRHIYWSNVDLTWAAGRSVKLILDPRPTGPWEATLNPKQIGASQDIVGCTIDGDDGQRCKTTLSDNTFSAGGTDYIVTQVFLNNDFSQLAFTIDKDVNAAVKGLSLYVDGREFPVAEATTDDRHIYWSNVDLTWAADRSVKLRLAPRPRLVYPTGLSVRPAGQGLITAWTAPQGTVAGYDVEYKESTAADRAAATANDPATGWVDAGHTGAATSHGIAGLTPGTTYDVRVRARSASGGGLWSYAQQGVPLGATSIGFSAPSYNVMEGTHEYRTITVNIDPVLPVASSATLRALTGDSRHTARAGDYTLPASVALPAGAATATFRVTINDDGDAEQDQTVVMGLGAVNGASYTVGRGQADLIIIDNEAVTLSFHSQENQGWHPVFRVAEGGTVALKAVLDRPAQFPITVTLTGRADTDPNTKDATENADYALEGATFTIPTGQTEPDVQPRVRTFDDAADDDGEHVRVYMSVYNRPIQLNMGLFPALVIIGPPSDDAPAAPTGLSVQSAGQGLIATWNAPADDVVTYDVEYKESTAADRVAATPDDPATGWVDAGHSGAARSHAITGLTPDTTYDVRVRARNAEGSSPWTEVKQVTALGAPSISFAESKFLVWEGYDQYATITVNIDPVLPVASSATLRALTGDSQHTAPADDYTLPESVALPAGAATATFRVTIDDDGHVELHRTLVMELAPVAGASYTVGLNRASLIITEDDIATVSFILSKPGSYQGLATVAEGGTVELKGMLDQPAPFPITVTLTSRADTDGNTANATEGVDYVIDGGTFTIPPGLTEPVVHARVRTFADAAADDGEVFLVDMKVPDSPNIKIDHPHSTHPMRVTIGAQSTTTPAAPAGIVVAPGAGQLIVTWTAPAETVTGYDVEYKRASAAGQSATTANDPATGWVDAGHAGADPSHTVSGLTGGTAYDVRVRAVNSALDSSKASSAWTTGQGTPQDPVTVSVSAWPVRPQEGEDVTVTATLSEALSVGVTVPLSVTPGLTDPAEAGDFSPLAGITIESGETSGTGTVATHRDDDADNETFTVELGSALPSLVQAGSPNSVTVTIKDAYALSTTLPEANENLSALTVAGGESATGDFTPLHLDAPFRTNLIYYGAAVDNSVTHVKLTPTAAHPDHATVEVGKEGNLTAVASGSASDAIALDVGQNVIIAEVRWGDLSRKYTVRVTRASSLPAPAAPTALAARVGDDGMTVTWSAPAGVVTGYDVEFKAAGATDWNQASRTGAVTTVTFQTDTGLDGGMAYDVRVRAVNEGGPGPWATGRSAPQFPVTTLTLSADGTLTEGGSVIVTGTLDQRAPAQTGYRLDISNTGFLQDIIADYSGFIEVNQNTFQVQLNAVDDDLTELTETATVTVEIDLDGDGAYDDLSDSIDVAILDNDPNAIVLTPSSAILAEGGDEATVTVSVQDPDAIPDHGWQVQVDMDGTANPGWDYGMTPTGSTPPAGDGTAGNRRIVIFNFTPTAREHTLRFAARADDAADGGETIIINAVDLNNPALKSAPLTLTIQEPGGQQNQQQDPAPEQQQQDPPNQAPTVVSALSGVTIVNRTGTRQVSLSGVFSDADSDALAVTAGSSNEAVATVHVAPGYASLTVTAQARGTAAITVTANDGRGGTVSDTFTVTVKAAPAVASDLADVSSLAAGSTQDVSLSGVFSDADGDALTVTAGSDNDNVATATVAADYSTLTVVGVAQGTATITVVAQDADGNRVIDDFDVSVAAPQQQQQNSPPNRAPTVSNAMSDATIVNRSGTHQASLSGVFSDADNDPLIVTAESDDEAVATVYVASGYASLTVAAQARGTAVITVTANDGRGGAVSDAFTVTVKAAPTVASALADVSGLKEGSTQDVSLAGVFSDADGDPLTVTAASSDNAIATVTVAADGSSLTLAGVSEGTATITVAAQDSNGNEVSDDFAVSVVKAPEPEQDPPPAEETPNQPPTVAAPLPDISLEAPQHREFDLSGVFHDPDGDVLTYTAVSSNHGLASMWVDGSTLTVVPTGTGTATITVTAKDPGGNRVSDEFEVTSRPAS